MNELLDARGVPIAPGDTAIYGFGVSRSVAMAEAVVLGECSGEHRLARPPLLPRCAGASCDRYGVSLTASGRVRLRVVRRSYSPGEKPVVDVAPDRLVVLKWPERYEPNATPSLPASPLPTQDEEARAKIQADIDRYTEGVRIGIAPEWWEAAWEPYTQYCAAQLKDLRRKMRALDG